MPVPTTVHSINNILFDWFETESGGSGREKEGGPWVSERFAIIANATESSGLRCRRWSFFPTFHHLDFHFRILCVRHWRLVSFSLTSKLNRQLAVIFHAVIRSLCVHMMRNYKKKSLSQCEIFHVIPTHRPVAVYSFVFHSFIKTAMSKYWWMTKTSHFTYSRRPS